MIPISFCREETSDLVSLACGIGNSFEKAHLALDDAILSEDPYTTSTNVSHFVSASNPLEGCDYGGLVRYLIFQSNHDLGNSGEYSPTQERRSMTKWVLGKCLSDSRKYDLPDNSLFWVDGHKRIIGGSFILPVHRYVVAFSKRLDVKEARRISDSLRNHVYVRDYDDFKDEGPTIGRFAEVPHPDDSHMEEVLRGEIPFYTPKGKPVAIPVQNAVRPFVTPFPPRAEPQHLSL